MSTSQDYKWITQRYSELQRKYPNRYVAVKNGRVVASGREFGKVYDAAIRKVKKDFVTGYILSGEPFVLNTRLQCIADGRLDELSDLMCMSGELYRLAPRRALEEQA